MGPFVIGVTGGIGSGKSAFCNILAKLGVPVFNADLQARDMMNENGAIRSSVLVHFGPLAYVNGVLDRKFIANIVFNDKKKLDVLNSIALPHLWSRFRLWCDEQHSRAVVIESATLVEHGGALHVDHIVVVTAPLEMRIERTMKRDGATRDQVMSRINSQITEEERLRSAHTIIENVVDIASMTQQAMVFKEMVIDSLDPLGSSKT